MTRRIGVVIAVVAASVCGLRLAAQSLFDEQALDEVLYKTYRFPAYSSRDVLTQHNDNNRTGASHWPGVNQNSIRGFKKIGEIPVDPEAVVSAQPLYAESALVNGVRQGVVIIATSNNHVFAVKPTSPFPRLWGPAAPIEAPLDTGDPFVTDPCDMRPNAAWTEHNPTNKGYMGIEATPVVDLSNNRVLVGYKTDTFEHRLAAIDLNNGHVVKRVTVPAPGGDPRWKMLHRNRASLLLADGVVYLAFSSLCEGSQERMHGSIVAFDARTLERVGEFRVTSGQIDGGGIWQGSAGPAADTDGNIYFVTGNRRLKPPCLVGFDDGADPNAPTLSNSVVRLHVEKRTSRGTRPVSGEAYTLRVLRPSFFTTYRRTLGDCADLDFGSSGPMLIPETRFLVAGGKEGLIYVMDRDNLGGFQKAGPPWDFAGAASMWTSAKHSAVPADDPSRDRVHQKFQAGQNTYDSDFPVNALMKWPHIHGTPVFGRFDPQHAFMFVWPEKDTLKRYQWMGVRLDANPTPGLEHAPPNIDDGHNGMPGGMLSVNVDPNSRSLGVVLASVKICDPGGPFRPGFSNPGFPDCSVSQNRGILRAYDPFTMQLIWSNKDDNYWFAKFVPPTVAAGEVFLPTASGKVLVYGR
jgi:hypothetical protein